jgi:hypothetical protein
MKVPDFRQRESGARTTDSQDAAVLRLFWPAPAGSPPASSRDVTERQIRTVPWCPTAGPERRRRAFRIGGEGVDASRIHSFDLTVEFFGQRFESTDIDGLAG